LVALLEPKYLSFWTLIFKYAQTEHKFNINEVTVVSVALSHFQVTCPSFFGMERRSQMTINSEVAYQGIKSSKLCAVSLPITLVL